MESLMVLDLVNQGYSEHRRRAPSMLRGFNFDIYTFAQPLGTQAYRFEICRLLQRIHLSI